MTIAEFISLRLKQLSCTHVFGVVGTSCSDFVDVLEKDDGISFISTVNELEAGYMADGFGRQGGIGAAVVSYGVGTLSMINAVASAMTERAPMIVINGGPRDSDYEIQEELGVLFSHSMGQGRTDVNVFANVTVAQEEIRKLENAAERIDRLFRAAMQKSAPVYLEVPQDLWLEKLDTYEEVFSQETNVQSEMTDVITSRIDYMLRRAKKPAILLGAELIRFNMLDKAIAFSEKHKIPFYGTLLSKGKIPEDHLLFSGIYDSDLAPADITKRLEDSDLIVALGCIMGIDQLHLVKKTQDIMFRIGFGEARHKQEVFGEVNLDHVIDKLNALPVYSGENGYPVWAVSGMTYTERRENWINKTFPGESWRNDWGHDTIIKAVADFLSQSDEDHLLALDTCLASFPGADIPLEEGDEFLSNPVWLSIGQGTPASVGAYFAHKKRPLIITGDGGFQMVSQTFSTMVQHNIPAIIVIIDNGSYAIEQFLIDGSYFKDHEAEPLSYTNLNAWKYENMPQIYNGGIGHRVHSYDELSRVLTHAKSITDRPVVIVADIPRRDLPAENRALLQ